MLLVILRLNGMLVILGGSERVSQRSGALQSNAAMTWVGELVSRVRAWLARASGAGLPRRWWCAAFAELKCDGTLGIAADTAPLKFVIGVRVGNSWLGDLQPGEVQGISSC